MVKPLARLLALADTGTAPRPTPFALPWNGPLIKEWSPTQVTRFVGDQGPVRYTTTTVVDTGPVWS